VDAFDSHHDRITAGQKASRLRGFLLHGSSFTSRAANRSRHPDATYPLI